MSQRSAQAQSALALLGADLLALSKEAGRRNADVRDAADKAYQLIKASPGREQALADLHGDPPPTPQPLYQPIFLASTTRNAKVIALAVSALQRLIAAGAVPRGLVKQILETLEQVIPQGVEIQLKILQTLVSLLTTNIGGTGERLVQGEELGQALELSHRLSTSKIPVVASTASATLRQLFMFVFERVQAEDLLPPVSLPPATFALDVPSVPEDGGPTVNKSITLRPAARDAYLLLEDLCLLIAGAGSEGHPEGEPSFLRWGSLSRTFGLELVESIVSGFGPVVRSHPELLLVLRAHLCPLLIRFLSAPPSSTTSTTFSFPLTLRLTRVIFLLLKQFSDLLPLEAEIFLSIFVRVISPSDRGDVGEGGHPSVAGGSCPSWMRVLALEIFRGLCGDFALMMAFFERYDKRESSSKVFSDLMMSFNRLATEKPAALGVGSAVLYGSSLAPVSSSAISAPMTSTTGSAMIDSAFEMGLNLATAASSAVSAASVPDGALSVQTATLKLQCIDQLDKAEAPAIPETYVFLLVLQCLASLADGFATTALGSYATLMAATGSGSAPPALDLSSPPSPLVQGESEDKDREARLAKLRTVRDMAEISWPALLASLSFFISTALDDDLFGDVVSALQNFTSVCGVLGLTTPREAFLTSLCKFAIPPSVVSHFAASSAPGSSGVIGGASSVLSASVESLGLTTAPPPVGLSSRNLACLRATISVAQYLAGSLDAIWFTVFETLQNAEFVLKSTSASKGRKKALPALPASPIKGGAVNTATPSSPSTKAEAGSGSGTKPIPVLPTEADEQAVQSSISKLFEVSRALDDGAFKSFVGALCRLSGEMVGIAMGTEKTTGSVASPGAWTPGGRRASGMSSMRTLRVDDKSFGISKLGVVSLLNVHRLIYRDADVGWNLITSHLLHIQHYPAAPATIRVQAAEVLDQILVVAPKNLSTGGDDLQKRIQTQVLVTLAAQAEPALRPQSSTDIEIRRMAFETLIKILESNGHSFIAGWERIFHVLRTACPPSSSVAAVATPPSPLPEHGALGTIEEDSGQPSATSYFGTDKSAKNPVLVRTSFPSLQLICTDFLGVLTVDELRDCIGTLAEFGKQTEDVNVALTAGGLLWGVSDHLQSKRKAGDNEVAHGELWMFLLHQLLALCQDSRQEARDGAITTIFRSISLYGSTLSKATWDACFWEIVFPLVDRLSATITMHNRASADESEPNAEDLVVQVNGPPIRLIDKQWDDSKTLALRSMGNVFFEYLPLIIKTSRYEETWAVFIAHLKRSFVEDRPPAATAAMQSFEKVLSVPLDGAEAARVASSWEVAWVAWDEIGHAVVALSQPPARGSTKALTQVNLEAYVKVALPIYIPPYITFDLARIHRLLAVLKAVLTYTRSPDFRPDIDSLTPLQAAVLEVVAAIRLEIPGAASAVLSDLSEYMTLAFIAAFDSESETSIRSRPRTVQRVSYIALTKEVMPHVLWLFQRYKDDSTIYDEGAVERMLASYALPLKLKHDCPAPSKFGSDELLWKTATVNFLKAVRDCVAGLRKMGSSLSSSTYEGIWRQVFDGYRGALLADSVHGGETSFEDLHEEENFDLALLISIEQDLLPHIGNPLVPDDLIRRLGKCLQTASRLYELDLPNRPSSSLPDAMSSAGSISEQDAKGPMFGTTAEVIEIGRERFAYWCLDLLFLLCSDEEQEGHTSERQRIAALCLPSLMNRCAAVMKTYVADAPLRGKMPFPRVRQEELIFVLQKLLLCRLHDGALWASEQPDPSSSILAPPPLDSTGPLTQLIRSALLRSPRAHLYEFHPLFTSLLSLSTTSPSITSAYIPSRLHGGASPPDSVEFKGLADGFTVKKIGRRATQLEAGDVVQLTLECLVEVGQEIAAGGNV